MIPKKKSGESKLWHVCVSFTLTPFMIAWRGVVLVKLWTWFAVPTFGIPAPSIAVAVGLVALVSVVAPQPSTGDLGTSSKVLDESTSGELLARAVGSGLLGPAVTLGLGAVAHWLAQ